MIFIEKLQMNRVRILRLSIFSTLTEEEDTLYSAYRKCNKPKQKIILKSMFVDKVKSYSGIRKIKPDSIYQKDADGNLTNEYRWDKQIALFESGMTRNIKTDENDECPLVTEIVFMICNQYDILKQIINDGVMIDDKKYLLYSSSTNQMKKETVTLLEEEFYNKHIDKLMGGLSTEIINDKGGINIGKLLAYKSLPMSSSVVLSDYPIDIDKVLIIPDYKTNVRGEVIYIDTETWQQERRIEDIPIEHWDGAGMFLHGLLPCSCQIRSSGGWIKGAVFPFDFRRFIDERNGSQVISDVYGNPCDVIAEDIQLILTKSQVKNCGFFKSMEEFRQAFKKHDLEICVNKLSPEPHENGLVHLPYQMTQSIPRKNFTDEALERLCECSVNLLNGALESKDKLFKLMDISEDNDNINWFYKSLRVAYDKLILDVHTQKKIKSFLDKEKKVVSGGKPLIEGYYSYIQPDMYALCERVFLGERNPKGLIPENHVYNLKYSSEGKKEVCCERSPHLSDCENAIRQLVDNDECRKWFGETFDTVVSCHDLITKSTMADVDGDEILVTPDRAFIELLDRDEIPLYYEMKKATATQINNSVIFDTLIASFENSIIGKISNTITKLFNTDNEPDVWLIRVLTAFNNFIIDFPKTQYKPNLLPEHEEEFRRFCEEVKAPQFFRAAKDKKKDNCENGNDSNVNRLYKYIRKNVKAIKITGLLEEVDCGKKFNPQLLTDTDIKVERTSEQYQDLFKLCEKLKWKSKQFEKYLKEHSDEIDKKAKYTQKELNTYFCYSEIKDVMQDFSDDKMASYLVDVEYYDEENAKKSKDILWNVFGEYLYRNICKNNNCVDALPIRKTIYKSNKQLQTIIKKRKSDYEKELKDKESSAICIYENEWEWMNTFKHRANSSTDKHLLYLLSVLYKKYKHNGWFNLFLAKSTKGYTRNSLDSILGSKISDKGIERLEKKGAIQLKKMRTMWKIKVNLPSDEDDDEDKTIFATHKGKITKDNNPLYKIYKEEGEQLKECVICEKLFLAEKNRKTCSSKCSRLLELQNKNKKSS